jgi:hypothetical protein
MPDFTTEIDIDSQEIWNGCPRSEKSELIGNIIVDTISEDLFYGPFFKDLMQDFYRFVYCYGSKLSSYGIQERIKVADKAFNIDLKIKSYSFIVL